MNTVRHIGLILDGNRRYSERVYSNRISGHSDGFQKLKEVLKWCSDAEIPEISVYAFSYDNWNRPELETFVKMYNLPFTKIYFTNNQSKLSILKKLNVIKHYDDRDISDELKNSGIQFMLVDVKTETFKQIN